MGTTHGRRRTGLGILAAAALAACNGPGVENPDQLWRNAEASIEARRFDEAQALFERLGNVRAPLPRDWMLRAQTALAREQDDGALAALAEIPNDVELASQARLLAGQVELRRDHARFAERYFLESIRLAPKAAQPRRELIYLYGMQLRRRELSEQFAALADVSSLRYENLFHWCLMRNCKWEAGEVAQTLGKFLAADSDDRESRLALADNDRWQVLYDEAEEALASLPENDARPLALRVMLLMERRQEDRVEERLAADHSNNPELARLNGRIALARRDGPEALRWYRIAYDDERTNRAAVFGLIHAYELCAQPDMATPLRKEAESLEAFNSLVQRMATPTGRSDPDMIRRGAQACT